jgi:hypothetical protein
MKEAVAFAEAEGAAAAAFGADRPHGAQLLYFGVGAHNQEHGGALLFTGLGNEYHKYIIRMEKTPDVLGGAAIDQTGRNRYNKHWCIFA